ncbi:MAG: FRG domain-containing protein [Clostridia bacterium]|nr:FRG domain-containing protein [Clostridia bacterium]
MAESFFEIITQSHLYKNLPDTYKKTTNFNNSSYNHLTFNITSLSEYIEVINVLRTSIQSANNNDGDLIFRGMADHQWELLPSIARQTLVTEETEYKMVKELMLLYPNEFSGISSNFDLLAKMQHYGLPTRLLDFTTNPLVALFFACRKEQDDSIGRVISTNPSYPQYLGTIDVVDRYIESVCRLCKVKSFGSYYLENLTDNKISFAEFIYCTKYPLIAKPQYSNNRIKNQAAVFMVFPNEILDYGAMSVYECFQENGTIENMNIREEYSTILSLENLAKIYPNIDTASVNSPNWFVSHQTLSDICSYYEFDIDIQRKSKFMSKLFSKNETPFPYRFGVVPQIKKIDDNIMRDDFCSILIEPKYKKKILEELDIININERFIFPELEYTVKYIKEKYWSPYKA